MSFLFGPPDPADDVKTKIDWNKFKPEPGSRTEKEWSNALDSAREAKYGLETKDLVVFDHTDLGLSGVAQGSPIIVYVMQVLMDRGFEVVAITRGGVICKRIKS